MFTAASWFWSPCVLLCSGLNELLVFGADQLSDASATPPPSCTSFPVKLSGVKPKEHEPLRGNVDPHNMLVTPQKAERSII